MRWACAFALISIGAALGSPSQDAPTFHVGTHLVQINVVVRDKNGPVTKLEKEDFVLTDRGKAQKISVFSATTPGETPATQPKLPDDVFSNRANGTGSVTVVLLDRLNTLSSPGTIGYESMPAWFEDHALGYAKEHLVEFVKQMDARDRVAIYSLARSLTVLSDFSGDRDQLLRVLNGYRATSVTDREVVDPGSIHTPVPGDFNGSVDRERRTLANLTNVNRAQITMSALMSIASHVAAIPGRKNLVWLTADLPFSGAAIARVLGRANVAVYPVDARGLLPKSLFSPPNDAAGVPGMGGRGAPPESRPRGQDVMDKMAEDTGRRAFINTNDLAGAIRSAVEDTAGTYTIGFYPESDTLDGKFHPLKVHLKQGHLDLRYPKGYFADKEAPLTESSLAEVAQSPLESGSIHLVARILRVDQPKPNSMSVSATIDLHDLQLVASGGVQKGNVKIVLIQQDAAGRIIGREEQVMKLELTQENYASLLKSGIFFRRVLEPKEGVATLRLLVADPSNAVTGSLIVPASQIQ